MEEEARMAHVEYCWYSGAGATVKFATLDGWRDEEIDVPPGTRDAQPIILTKLGAQGWELTGFSNRQAGMYFKRNSP
jgi:hypothetical protein